MLFVPPPLRRLLLAFIAIVLSSAGSQAAELYWNFGTGADAPVSTPSGLPDDVTGGIVTQGNNNGTTTMITSSSVSSGYVGASGSNNAGAAARIGDLNPAANGSAYFEFTLTPAAGRRLTLSSLQFGSRSTSTGPQAFAVRTIVNGITSTVATGTLANNSAWTLQTPSIGLIAAPTDEPVAVRIYGYAGTGSASANTANWRIDDLRITVTTAVDEVVDPAVIATVPAADAVDVAVDAGVTVTFNQPVAVSGNWFTVVSAASGPLAATASGGPTTFTLTPTAPWPFDDIVTITVLASQVAATDDPTRHPSADYAWSFVTEPEPPPPGGAATLYWNFGTAATGGVASPTGLPTDLAGGAVMQGNNNGTTPLLTTTSTSSGYTGASGGFNAGAAARIGSLNTEAGGSAYFEFTLTPAVARRVILDGLSFGSRSTGTGPQAYTIFTSADNFVAPVAAGPLLNNATWALITPQLTTSIIAASSTPLTVRIYGHSGGGSPAANTANWRIDDLTVEVEMTDGDPIAPAIASTTPADGAFDIEPTSPITLTFNQPVITSEPWFSITGSVSGPIAASATGGPTTFTLTPLAPFALDEAVTVTVVAAGVVDAASGTLHPISDQSFTFSTPEPVTKIIPISTVQGSGEVSPRAGRRTTVLGVVVGDFQGASPNLGGFYVQSLATETDSDDTTSEGIFVFDQDSSATIDVALGDIVRVTGTVTEFFGLTEINAVTFVAKEGAAPLPEPVVVTLPVAATTDLERYEGMRVRFAQELTVTGNRSLGQFGELVLSAGGRLLTPTNVLDVNDDPADGVSSSGTSNKAAVDAYLAANTLRRIVLDDASTASYPATTPFLNAQQTRRIGDTVTDLVGVLSFGFQTYRVLPTAPVAFTDANPRSATPPSVGAANLRVASFNVLNYFNGDGLGGGFPTSRGANTAEEFARQRAKIIAALAALDADVIGLIEIENDGVAAISAIADLVDGLNALLGAGTYAIGAAPTNTGTDEIKVAFIYRSAVVTPVGPPATDLSTDFDRPPLAQTYALVANGETLTVCINHFKSKRSGADDGTGQGLDNGRRKLQAQRLITFLNGVAAAAGDSDVLIIGDLNAYAEEDPIDILRAAGYVDQIARFNPGTGYSYSFDEQSGYLDHALASASLSSQVTGAVEWHINSDEPPYLDYNLENKSAVQQAINVGTPFRSSDHDPVLVGLALTPPPAPPAITGPLTDVTRTAQESVTFTVAASGTAPLSYVWRQGGTLLADGGRISGATTNSLTIVDLTSTDAGDYEVVVSNAVGSAASSATLTVAPIDAVVTLGALSATYDGAPHAVTVETTPSGLAVEVTYNGNAEIPVNAGSYAVVATITDPDYAGTASGTLTIAPAAATVSLGNLERVYDGAPKPVSVTTLPAGISVSVTYDGETAAPVNAGSYAVAARVTDPNYTGSAAGTLVISPATATVVLEDLEQAYDGAAKPVSVTTTPADRNVVITYNGSAIVPIYPGSYAVAATIDEPNYVGSANGTLVVTITALVRHAPTISGGVDGSLQMLLPESVVLDGAAWVSGDLLVPGAPSVVVHKSATYGSTLEGPGSGSPTNHQVTLGNGTVLRHVVRRIDSIVLPTVGAPPRPAGKRNVTINSPEQSIGDPTTLRNLTLNSNVGQVIVPPGTYGAFTANRGSGFTLGIAGASAPAVYNLRELTLNNGSEILVVGPVIINLATGPTLSGSIAADPASEPLTLRAAAGGVTLNSGVTVRGHIVAPTGTITINRNSAVIGSATSDRLIINSGALLTEP